MSSSEGENPPDEENEHLSEIYERIITRLEKHELYQNSQKADTIFFGKTKVPPKIHEVHKHSRFTKQRQREQRKGKRGPKNTADMVRSKQRRFDRDVKKGVRRGAQPHVRWDYATWAKIRARWEYTSREAREAREKKRKEEEMKAQEKLRIQMEEERVKPIIIRKRAGFVEHRRKKKDTDEKDWIPKKLASVEKRAKFHLSVIANMESDEKKANYLAQLLGYNEKRTKEKEKEEWTEDEESFAEKSDVLVRAVLGHFHTEDLARTVDFLEKYEDKRSFVTEEVLLSSITRTLNTARKTLLAGTRETKLDAPVTMKAFDTAGYAHDFFVVQPLDTTEKMYPILPLEVECWTESLKYGAMSITPCKEAFEYAFDVFTNKFFRGVNITGGIIAGGSVSACLQPLNAQFMKHFAKYRQKLRTIKKLPVPAYILDRIVHYSDLAGDGLEFFKTKLQKYFDTAYSFSDIDIFIIANSLEEAETKMKRIVKNIKNRFKQLNSEYVMSRTANAITFCSKEYRNIQIVVSVLRSLDDFLLFCDLDCTSCAYDGREVYMSPRSARAFNKRYNVFPPSQLNSQVTRARLLKYAKRGFSALVFELPKYSLRSDGTLQSDPKRHFEHLQNASLREKHRIMAFGEYSEQRPFADFQWDSKESMEQFFANRGVPYGQKLKDVWRRDGSENRESKKNETDENLYAEVIIHETPGDGETKAQIPSAEMRWKWLDTLKSHDVDHLLPRCYMCKKRSAPEFQPEQTGLTLCIECAAKNREMMDQWDKVSDIDDCVALVTGARIKIGYFIALRLLRSGATVIASTRFPHDAALKYAKEPDFEKWKHKLHIYGVDLRHLPSVSEFIAHVVGRYKRIDMLINNAAQTKRRPRAYYYEVVNRERALMAGELTEKFLVKNFSADPFMIEYDVSPDSKAVEPKRNTLASALVPVMAVGEVALDGSLPKSAALTQVQLHPMNTKERDDELFPPGKVDEHNEPLDTRASTTWNQKIDEISPVELMEVQIVNSTVPFMFISSFTPLLKEAAAISHHKRAFVVNVTAVEGIFSKNKRNGGHPHTNMAKAALNMLTKSIGDTFAHNHIYTTAVDTGWCTEMRYVPMHERDASGVPLHPVPLTDKDGAARVLYPIFVGLTSEAPPPHGVLYHDYEVVPWI